MATDATAEAAQLLKQIYTLISEATYFEEVYFELEQKLLELLQAERLTVYRRDSNDLVSWQQTGAEVDDVISVPIGTSSITGYVALTNQPLRIDDVYDATELAAIHPELKFEQNYDQRSGYMTESMIVVPLSAKDKVLGAVQVINRLGGGKFSDQDLIHCAAIAKLIVDHFKAQLKLDAGPFRHLIQEGLLSVERFEELSDKAQQQAIPVTILLKKEEKLLPADIGTSLSVFYETPYLGYDESLVPDPQLLENLNPGYLAVNNWVPFRLTADHLMVLIDDPSNAARIMEIQQLLGVSDIDLRVGTREDIHRYLGVPYPEDEEEEDENLDNLVGKLDANLTIDGDEFSEEELYDENASIIIQLVNHIIIESVNLRASDIHIEPGKGKNDAIVRMRIDGACTEVLHIPHTHIKAVIARIKVLSGLDITEKRKPQDGKMGVTMEGAPLELRIAITPTVNGESAVMRVLASGTDLMTVDMLGLHERNHEGILECLSHPHGIFLCVGPTGSGKTTTLHALLGHINTIERKIVTAEDPVEITQPGLQQVQMMPQIGLTFAAALRTFLRASPDVILIGEMRDYETAHIGTEASLTGHLVFSTLHTNSASETVVRLFDLGLDPMNFADALLGILAQRLVRTLCKRCKEPYQASPKEVQRLANLYGDDMFDELGYDRHDVTLYRPVGCDDCRGTGYRGRMGIHELLLATPEMKKLVAAQGTVPQIKDLATKEGMRTLLQDGIYKIMLGKADLAQLRRVTVAG